jgi:hypothetical protein
VSVAVTLIELAARPKGGEGVKSGPIALAIILVLCIVAYFLFKSMSKHLKKVRDEFPTDQSEEPRSGGNPEPPGTPAAASSADPDSSETTSPPARDKPPRAEVPPDSSA